MTFESEGFLIVAFYIWLPPASYVVFSDNSGWTVRDRDFMFDMHTPLMLPFQMIPRSMTLWPWSLK